MFKKLFTAAWLALLFTSSHFASAATNVNVTATPSNPTAPATVTLAASGDSDGNPIMVTKVEYFNGTTSLGVSVQSPFTLTLNNLAAGTYQISVKVTTTDPDNPVLQSAPLDLTVGTAPGAAAAYFIHTDQLNTPRAITDGSGKLVWQWDSDPFGMDAPHEQPTGQPAFTFNQRFPGQQFDRESNLHYNYYRDYDPLVGRYVQSDPIGLKGGINTYSYVEADPISLTDPFGLQVWSQGSLPPRVQSHNEWANVDKQMQKEFVNPDTGLPIIPKEGPIFDCKLICPSSYPVSCPAPPASQIPIMERSPSGEMCERVCVTGEFASPAPAIDQVPNAAPHPRSAGRGDWQKLFRMWRR